MHVAVALAMLVLMHFAVLGSCGGVRACMQQLQDGMGMVLATVLPAQRSILEYYLLLQQPAGRLPWPAAASALE